MRALVFLALAQAALADVSLPTLFTDGMVLQADSKITVWGRADPGEKVTVTFEDGVAEAVADEKGNWQAVIGPYTYRAARTLVVAGRNRIEIKDVCVGEVWICSGQSNMQWPLKQTDGAADEIAQSKHPRLRLFTVPRRTATAPQADCGGKWQSCGPDTVAAFSAVAYYFGTSLREKVAVPVGLIHTSWGGTPAEAWTSMPALAAEPELAPILERWETIAREWPEKAAAHRKAVAEWQKTRQGRRPRGPIGPNHPHRASGLYNGMIAPLTRYAIRGAIWYQGESNATRAWQYRTLFPLMIRDWRRAWGRGDFPFAFVQLANFMQVEARPGEHAWAELREAQAVALKEPNTGMAVTIDIGAARDIHPRNKRDVGKRLALWALANVYGKPCVYSGPVYKRHEIRGELVAIAFDHVGGGLRARNNEPLRGFAIAGADKVWRWAHSKFTRGGLLLWHPDIAEPKAVRYAWAANPVSNLTNAEGLPAAPFRTDDWPATTRDAK